MGLEEYQGMTSDQKLTTLCVKMDNIEKSLDERKGMWGPRTAWLMVVLCVGSLVVSCIALVKGG